MASNKPPKNYNLLKDIRQDKLYKSNVIRRNKSARKIIEEECTEDVNKVKNTAFSDTTTINVSSIDPAKLNTKDETAYVIRNGLFVDLESGETKNFVTSETDILADDYYLQSILTSLYLVLNGVQPNEAVMYINDACTRSVAKVDTRMLDINRIKRRL